MNKRKVGKYFEEFAIKYLERKSYKILTRNFYYKGGEIDIIAYKSNKLHFIEVKYRATDKYGMAIESIDNKKINRIKKGINYFLYINAIDSNIDISINLFLIDGNNVEIIELI